MELSFCIPELRNVSGENGCAGWRMGFKFEWTRREPCEEIARCIIVSNKICEIWVNDRLPDCITLPFCYPISCSSLTLQFFPFFFFFFFFSSPPLFSPSLEDEKLERTWTYLRIVAELRLIVEYVQIRVSTGLAMKICRSRSRCHGVRIPQGFQGLVPERNIISK